MALTFLLPGSTCETLVLCDLGRTGMHKDSTADRHKTAAAAWLKKDCRRHVTFNCHCVTTTVSRRVSAAVNHRDAAVSSMTDSEKSNFCR
jgi:hypothetical protein